MSESKPYKIDTLKLQQKIYSLYPANAQARKLMIKKDQMLELNSLILAKKLIFPDDQVSLLVERLKAAAQKSFIFFSCGVLAVLLSISLPSIFSIGTPLKWYSFYLVVSGLGIWTLLKLKQLILIVREINNINKDAIKLTARIKELTDHIFKDL